jgi:hypothetical protein
MGLWGELRPESICNAAFEGAIRGRARVPARREDVFQPKGVFSPAIVKGRPASLTTDREDPPTPVPHNNAFETKAMADRQRSLPNYGRVSSERTTSYDFRSKARRAPKRIKTPPVIRLSTVVVRG